MRVIIDPSGPIGAKPAILLEPPKAVNILNPRAETRPRLALPYGRKPIAIDPGHCGWFIAFLLDPRYSRLHFEAADSTATYVKTSYANPAVDYDIAAEFVSKGVPGLAML